MSAVLLCQGTARALPLQDASVHCVVTSPPYYGLRDYSTGTWHGGDVACTHVQRQEQPRSERPQDLVDGNKRNAFGGPTDTAQTNGRASYRRVCGRCGATRVDRQLGLEASPDAYVAAMVQVFREVKRVLRPDGTLWLNMGDSMAGHKLPGWRPRNEEKNGGVRNKNGAGYVPGIPAKNLLGMPWRLAFALQADGWVLRSDCIWDKPSCMPESVQDRPTRSHEYVFLFSKQAHYHYDAHAIREPGITGYSTRSTFLYSRVREASPDDPRGRSMTGQPQADEPEQGRNARTVWRSSPGYFRLRSDLSASDRAYVLGELLKRGLGDNTPNTTDAHPEVSSHNQDRIANE